jgi:site-specific recombinase XerD
LDGVAATAEWVDWLKARGSPETTWRSYSSYVSRFLIHYVRGHPEEANTGDVVRFLAEVGKNGPHGRRQALKGLRSAFSYWVPVGICPADPTGMVKETRKQKTRRQVALTEEELVRYLVAAAARDPRRAAALMATFGLGARRSELAGIRPDDILEDRVRVTGKYGKTREIPLNETARAGLEMLRPWYNGTILGGLKASTVTKWAHQAAVDSGLYPKVRGRVAHVLRASFISHALRNGANPVAVRDVAGHESLSTTDGYSMAFEEDGADAVRRVDNLSGGPARPARS